MQLPQPAMHAAALADCLPAVGLPKAPHYYDGSQVTRLAIMGGSYGNVPALSACLQDAARLGCNGFAFLGDATGFCGHSDEIIALVRANFPVLIAGNYEQKAAAAETDCGCNYPHAEDNIYGSLAHQWAMRSLSDVNRAWLGTWPNIGLLQTAQGTILLCHGSPEQTNEFLYESQLDDERLAAWLDSYDAVGLACTHSGFPWIRSLPEGRFAVNCGVCGKPDHDGDPAVHYAVLELTEATHPVLRIARVEYDCAAWADQLAEEGVAEIFTGALRDGTWQCGLLSLPETERTRATRVCPEELLCLP